MKKITFLFSLLLTFLGVSTAYADAGDVITDLSQLSADKFYTLVAPRGVLSAGDSKVVRVESVTNNGTQYFGIEETEAGGTYYVSTFSKGYVKSSDLSYETSKSSSFSLVASGSSWLFKNENKSKTLNINGEKVPVMDGWSQADAGNMFTITEVGSKDFVLFTVALNSAKTLLDNNAETVGKLFCCSAEAYNALQEVYNQYKDKTTATQEDIDAVNAAIAAFNSAPLSSSVIADGTEVMLGNKLHTNLYVYAKDVKRDGSKGGFLGSAPSKDSYRYLFTIKTTSDGKYKIYSNYYKKYVGAIPTGNDKEITLVDEASAGEYTIDAASTVGYCRIYDANCTYKSGQVLVNAWHMVNWADYKVNGNGVVRWVKDADASAFKLILVTDADKTAWNKALEAKLNAAKTHKGTCIGDFNAEAVAAAEAAYTAAEDKSTVAKATDDALLASRVAPVVGKYYTISNATNTDKFITENYNSQTTNGENKLTAAVQGANIMPTLWRFEQMTSEAQTDLYRIIAANSGKCMSKSVWNYTMHVTTTDNANAGVYDIFNKDVVNKEHAVSLVYYTDWTRADRGTASINRDYVEIKSWNVADQNNNFLINEVTEIPVAISAARYATLNLPCAVTIPTDVKAYTATDGETEVTLSEITDGVIPANTPVILVGDEGTYNFTIDTENTTAAISSALNGTLVPTAVAADASAYILKNGAQGIGMYKITSETDRTIAANKAYMGSTTAASSSNMKVFNFGGISTGINNAVAGNAKNNVYYDLNGRRVLYPAHGVFVKANGEKVYIK